MENGKCFFFLNALQPCCLQRTPQKKDGPVAAPRDILESHVECLKDFSLFFLFRNLQDAESSVLATGIKCIFRCLRLRLHLQEVFLKCCAPPRVSSGGSGGRGGGGRRLLRIHDGRFPKASVH